MRGKNVSLPDDDLDVVYLVVPRSISFTRNFKAWELRLTQIKIGSDNTPGTHLIFWDNVLPWYF